MYYIDRDNIISITAGDSFEQTVTLKDGQFPYMENIILEENDIAVFGVMRPNDSFEHAFIKKQLDTENILDDNGEIDYQVVILRLDPEDTCYLEPGTYYYEIKVLSDEGEGKAKITTVINKTKFIVVS